MELQLVADNNNNNAGGGGAANNNNNNNNNAGGAANNSAFPLLPGAPAVPTSKASCCSLSFERKRAYQHVLAPSRNTEHSR